MTDLSSEFKETGDKVFKCVEEQIRLAANDPTDPDKDKFAEIKSIKLQTKLAIYEKVADDFQDIWKQGEGGPEAFCKERVFPQLKRAFLEAYDDWKAQGDGVLAKVGLRDFAHIASFINFFQNNLGAHTFGHSDITEKSLESLQSEFENNYQFAMHADAIWLIASASMATDFYGWETEAYHAHTPEHECCDLNRRMAAIAEGQRQFVELFKKHWRAATATSDAEELAYHIGTLCHMIQDLMYHEGITVLQHAGLSYFVDKDPDLPDGFEDFPNLDPEKPAGMLFARAQAATSEMIMKVMEEAKIDAKVDLLNWSERRSATLDFDDIAERSHAAVNNGDRQTLNELAIALSMFDYYSTASAYAFDIRDPDVELVPVTSNNPYGLTKWSVDAVKSKLYD